MLPKVKRWYLPDRFQTSEEKGGIHLQVSINSTKVFTSEGWNALPARQVSLYCAGFPCTPYSLLHAGSRLLEEEAAAPLYKVVDNIRGCQSPASWLTICYEQLQIQPRVSFSIFFQNQPAS